MPEIRVDLSDVRIEEMTLHLRRLGASALVANDIAAEGVQALFAGRWQTATLQFVGREAMLYERAFGDLEGFDAERVSRIFLPQAKTSLWKGRGINVLAKTLRAEMRSGR